jgi:hypothetical protein
MEIGMKNDEPELSLVEILRLSSEERWNFFVTTAFKAVDLPEVAEDALEEGQFSNASIAESFRHNIPHLVSLLIRLPEEATTTEKRNILSAAVAKLERVNIY